MLMVMNKTKVWLLFLLLLSSCSPDIFYDDTIKVKRNIYLYHQNGTKGYLLVYEEKGKDGFRLILNNPVIEVNVINDSILVAIDNKGIKEFFCMAKPDYGNPEKSLIVINEAFFDSSAINKIDWHWVYKIDE